METKLVDFAMMLKTTLETQAQAKRDLKVKTQEVHELRAQVTPLVASRPTPSRTLLQPPCS